MRTEVLLSNRLYRSVFFPMLAVLFVAVGQSPLHAQPQRYSGPDLERQQGEVRLHLEMAERETRFSAEAVSGNLMGSAWESLTQAGVRLNRAKSTMDLQASRIPYATNRAGFHSRTWQERLREGLADVHEEYNRLMRRVEAMEEDLGGRLGVDVAWITAVLTNLDYLCEHVRDASLQARFCDFARQLRAAIEAGDSRRAEEIAREAARLIAEVINNRPGVIGGEGTGGLVPTNGPPNGPPPPPPNGWSPVLHDLCDRITDPALRRLLCDLAAGPTPPGPPPPNINRWVPVLNDLARDCEQHPDPEVRRIACMLLELMKRAVQTGNFQDMEAIMEIAEYIEAYASLLRRLCEEHPDAEIRRAACALLERLLRAAENGDLDEILRIFGQANWLAEQAGERKPNPNIPPSRPPSNGNGNGNGWRPDDPLPPDVRRENGFYVVTGPGGERRYFPADLSQPGIGRAYLGDEGTDLIEEKEEFLEFFRDPATSTGTGYRINFGDERDWNFSVQLGDQRRRDDGVEMEFRLIEGVGEGAVDDVRWRVRSSAPDGATIAEGTGERGSFLAREAGEFMIEFEGRTDWGSPFQVSLRVSSGG